MTQFDSQRLKVLADSYRNGSDYQDFEVPSVVLELCGDWH